MVRNVLKNMEARYDQVSLAIPSCSSLVVGGGVSRACTWYMCAAGPPHTHPINVYWNMEKYTYKCVNHYRG